MGLYIFVILFLRSFRRAGYRRGLIICGGFQLDWEKRFETSFGSVDEKRFCIYWLLMKLLNLIINGHKSNSRKASGGTYSRGGGGSKLGVFVAYR